MEKQLFSWKEFEDINDYCFNFYDCILKQDIGEYTKDTQFDTISMDFEKGQIELINNNTGDVEAIFEFLLQIGDKIA